MESFDRELMKLFEDMLNKGLPVGIGIPGYSLTTGLTGILFLIGVNSTHLD